MQRILETYQFGPHRVVVVEQVDDEDVNYAIVVDDRPSLAGPLASRPCFEDVVRLYAQSLDRAAH